MARPPKDDHIAAALRFLPGVTREQLVRKLRRLPRGPVPAQLPPGNIGVTATEAAMKKTMKFLEAAEHPVAAKLIGDLVRRGYRYLPYDSMVKPWRGAAGRAALKKKREPQR